VRLPTAIKVNGSHLKKYSKIIIFWFLSTATEKDTSEGDFCKIMKYQQRSMAYMILLGRKGPGIDKQIGTVACCRDRQARRQICFMAGKQDRGSVWQDFFVLFPP
jgi:hypothetical protein